jgi:hypothetical protein
MMIGNPTVELTVHCTGDRGQLPAARGAGARAAGLHGGSPDAPAPRGDLAHRAHQRRLPRSGQLQGMAAGARVRVRVRVA